MPKPDECLRLNCHAQHHRLANEPQSVAVSNSATFVVSATGIQTTNPITAGAPPYCAAQLPMVQKRHPTLCWSHQCKLCGYECGAQRHRFVFRHGQQLAGIVTRPMATLAVDREFAATCEPATYFRNAGFRCRSQSQLWRPTGATPTGDTVTLTGVNSSTNGADPLVPSEPTFFHNSTNNGGTDQFSYSVSDGYGGTTDKCGECIDRAGFDQCEPITGTAVNGDGSIAEFPVTRILARSGNKPTPPAIEPISTNAAGTNGLRQFIDLQATNDSQKFIAWCNRR